MNNQESAYFQAMEQQLQLEQTRRMNAENRVEQTSGFQSLRDPNIAELQLEMEKQLDRIYHLLRGDLIKTDPNTQSKYWAEPDDDRMRILTKYGVDQIMNILSTYVDKSFVLSDYDDATILTKVLDFGNEINDLIHNRSEAFFYYPTPEELFDKYAPVVIKNKLDIRADELYQKCVAWSNEELQARLPHYSSSTHLSNLSF